MDIKQIKNVYEMVVRTQWDQFEMVIRVPVNRQKLGRDIAN